VSTVVHFRGEQLPRQSELEKHRYWPLCGLATVVVGERVSHIKAKVTCSRCRIAIAKAKSGHGRLSTLPRSNRKRRRERFKQDFAEQAAACRVMRCVVPGCTSTRSQPHHEPPRSCGGADKDTVALCPDHHTLGPDARHNIGEHEFNRRFGINLRQLAAALHEQLSKDQT
jgi:hypothetical protein